MSEAHKISPEVPSKRVVDDIGIAVPPLDETTETQAAYDDLTTEQTLSQETLNSTYEQHVMAVLIDAIIDQKSDVVISNIDDVLRGDAASLKKLRAINSSRNQDPVSELSAKVLNNISVKRGIRHAVEDWEQIKVKVKAYQRLYTFLQGLHPSELKDSNFFRTHAGSILSGYKVDAEGLKSYQIEFDKQMENLYKLDPPGKINNDYPQEGAYERFDKIYTAVQS